MKSKKAKEFIDGCLNHLVIEMSDHAKWQLRAAMSHTAELAEQEAEERMRDKAIEAFCKDCPIYSIQTMIEWCMHIGYEYIYPPKEERLGDKVICDTYCVGVAHDAQTFTALNCIDCGTNIELFRALAADSRK